jgi:hypothetical protein
MPVSPAQSARYDKKAEYFLSRSTQGGVPGLPTADPCDLAGDCDGRGRTLGPRRLPARVSRLGQWGLTGSKPIP